MFRKFRGELREGGGGGGGLPHITIRGRAEIWGILFARYNPDFRVVLGRCPHVPDFWVCFQSSAYTNPRKGLLSRLSL